ncbi:MAG: cupin domain-containing protein [Actinomycetota bacterium]|nr:cupin domain-containing protein [Actinomycetota bacterium]
MNKASLDALARHLLAEAESSSAGRGAHTVYGGHEHVLRQTLIALRKDAELSEHANPGEATVHVLVGRVELISPVGSWEGRRGDLITVPLSRHALRALESSVILLTVAKLAGEPPRSAPAASGTAEEVTA